MTASWPTSTPMFEADERRGEPLGRNPVIAKHRGEAQPMQKPEGEDQRGAPPDIPPPDRVLDPDIDDGRGDQRLHDTGRDGHDPPWRPAPG